MTEFLDIDTRRNDRPLKGSGGASDAVAPRPALLEGEENQPPQIKVRQGDLTEMQTRFVIHFTTTDGAIGNKAEAARLAGYSERSAKEIGHQLINKPHVRAAIDEANQRQLSGPMATKAIARLDRILSDDTTPLKIMLDAIKTTLDRAGHIAPKAEERRDPETAKQPADMTLGELEAIAAEGRKRLKAMRDAASPAEILEGTATELESVDE